MASSVLLSSTPVRAGAPDTIVQAARRWFVDTPGVFFAPGIPLLREAGARAPHGAYVLESEVVLVLYDATLLGTGENGFFVTAERLCWKNLLEHARQIEWGDIDPAGIASVLGRVEIAGGSITVSGEIATSAAGFIAETAARGRRASGGPYRVGARLTAEGPAGDRLSLDALTAVVRRGLGEVADFFYQPAIPPLKLRRARATYAGKLPPDEPVGMLYDDTFFGGAAEGFMLTPRWLCWKNLTSGPAALPWEAIPPDSVVGAGNIVHFSGGALHVTAHRELADRIATLLRALARG